MCITNNFIFFLSSSLSLSFMKQSNNDTNIQNGIVQRIHDPSSIITTTTTTTTTIGNDHEAMGIDEVDRRLAAETCDNDEIMNIITELDGTKRQLNAERQRVSELEDQLSSLSKFCGYPNEIGYNIWKRGKSSWFSNIPSMI